MNDHSNHSGNGLPHQRIPIFSSVYQPYSAASNNINKGSGNRKRNGRLTFSLTTMLWVMIVIVGIVVCYSLVHFTNYHPTEAVSKWFYTVNVANSAGKESREQGNNALTDSTEEGSIDVESVKKSETNRKNHHEQKIEKDLPSSVRHIQSSGSDSGVFNKKSYDYLKKAQQKVIDHVVEQLEGHPLHRFTNNNDSKFGIEDYLYYLSRQPECKGIPIFVSMANVFSELYWQM